MKRRISVFLLALCMVLSLLPATAWAEIKSGTMVNNIDYSYNTETKALTLSCKYETTLSGNGFTNPLSTLAKLPINEIETVVMKSGITGIGSLAFLDCRSLTSISNPKRLL